VAMLSEELSKSKREYRQLACQTLSQKESIDLKRITKVQSLCRGWLYRKRWTRIVRDYIESPDATSLRRRNRLVFELVEREGEYTRQLEKLVNNFLIPFRMSACSSKPTVTHEEINCVFLNSEILLFMHQIFYKGKFLFGDTIEAEVDIIYPYFFKVIVSE
jgi:Ras-specific guanine nucleotide-releasing factor 1